MHPASLPSHCVLPRQEDAASCPAARHGEPQLSMWEMYLHRLPSRQAQQDLYCNLQLVREMMFGRDTANVCGTFPALAEVLPAGSRRMERDWQSPWAGQEGQIAGAVGMGGPGASHLWLSEHTCPREMLTFYPPTPQHSQ